MSVDKTSAKSSIFSKCWMMVTLAGEGWNIEVS